MYPTRVRNIGTGFILVTSLAGVAIMEVVVSYIYTLYNIVGIGIMAVVAFIIYVVLAYLMAENTAMKDLEVVSP